MMIKKLKNESGVALMIVLAAVTLLTAVSTDFVYKTNISYHLAVNQKERMQAYFLAESAIKLMELEIKLEKELRSQAAAAGAAATGDFSAPLCQQFPLSTSLIRSMFMGQPTPEAAAAGEEEGERAAFIGAMQVETAEEFLDFEGDFEGTCADESAKFNLNIFAGKNPKQEVLSGFNSYDQAKQLLIGLLANPAYKMLFPEDSPEKIGEIARNVADWVDIDDAINEPGGATTGSENSQYPPGITEYGVKSGKFLTLDEMHKVAGVKDDWFLPIKDRFTIYGDTKLNVCLAPDEMVAALIVQYANSKTDIPAINPANKAQMSNLVSVVKNGCTGASPKVEDIAKALDGALGVAGSTGAGSFASQITTESRYYSFAGTGIVGNTEVKITAVIDTKEPTPTRWRMVYWRVE